MNAKSMAIVTRRPLDALLYSSAVLVILLTGVTFLFTGVSKYPELLGMGLLSFTLGLRHAFDADHISAVDNMVRKLIQQRKNPRGVGFFFACGHSTVVMAMALITIFAVRWAETRFPQFQEASDIVTGLASGVFLLILALINLLILRDVVRAFRSLKAGLNDHVSQEAGSSEGMINRSIKFLFNLVNNNGHAFLVGLLFGFAFDTVTQIAVLGASASAVSREIPLLTVLSFPILFAAGMTMMDTLDGFFMSTAYQWIFYSPLRKVYYNLTITGLSILAAGVIGIIKIAQILTGRMGLDSGFWLWLQDIDFNTMGYILVGMFALVWAVSLMVWKLARLGEKENGIAQ